jgi:hypothetical protein
MKRRTAHGLVAAVNGGIAMATHTLHRLIFAGALTAAFLLFPSAARAEGDFTGLWRTNMGDMHIEQDGDRARGDYEMKDGRMHGGIDGDAFSGFWAQSSAAHRCFEERMESHYWGRFTLILSDDTEHFHGRWSYCNDDPGSGGEWTGSRRHHHF